MKKFLKIAAIILGIPLLYVLMARKLKGKSRNKIISASKTNKKLVARASRLHSQFVKGGAL